MTRRASAALIALVLAAWLLVPADEAWARAGSGGSRGSRSYSAPARPAPTSPVSPSRSYGQPSASTPGPGLARPGFLGGLGGFLMGGLLGGLLFGGLGHGAGIGMLDLLLVGGGLFLLLRWIGRRREAGAPAYATVGGGWSGGGSEVAESVAVQMPAAPGDLERGVAHIRQMDPGFEPAVVADQARAVFSTVQRAVAARDVGPVAGCLTARLYTELREQCDRLRGAGRTNAVEAIEVRRAEASEAWQEGGQDWVTVYVAGSLVDYVIDDGSGAVVEGSRTAPQEFEEFWTFTRPVGPNPWKLSAIQTP